MFRSISRSPRNKEYLSIKYWNESPLNFPTRATIICVIFFCNLLPLIYRKKASDWFVWNYHLLVRFSMWNIYANLPFNPYYTKKKVVQWTFADSGSFSFFSWMTKWVGDLCQMKWKGRDRRVGRIINDGVFWVRGFGKMPPFQKKHIFSSSAKMDMLINWQCSVFCQMNHHESSLPFCQFNLI